MNRDREFSAYTTKSCLADKMTDFVNGQGHFMAFVTFSSAYSVHPCDVCSNVLKFLKL